MFTFEDIILLSDLDLSIVLGEVEISSLAVAIKTKPDEFRQRVASNISERGNVMLGIELDQMTQDPTENEEVEAQREIVEVARKLDKEKKIRSLLDVKLNAQGQG